jgi:hypothetical protein
MEIRDIRLLDTRVQTRVRSVRRTVINLDGVRMTNTFTGLEGKGVFDSLCFLRILTMLRSLFNP